MSPPSLSPLVLECARPRPDAGELRRVASSVDWPATLRHAACHRMRPLLYWRLSQACPDLVPLEVLEDLKAAFHSNVCHNLKLAAELASIALWLKLHQIPVAAFKGPSLAALAYQNLGLRESGDLDLLVPHEQLHAAVEALEEKGYACKGAQGAVELRGNIEVVLGRENAADIDLHWDVSPKYFLSFNSQQVWARLQNVVLAGKPVATFSNEDLFVSLALHGCRHCWTSLHWICDIAHLLESQPLDWNYVLGPEHRSIRRALLVTVLLVAELGEGAVPREVVFLALHDKLATRLAAAFRENLGHPCPDLAGTPRGALMQIQMAGFFGDKVRYLWQRALVPNQIDNEFVRLPKPLRPAFYAIRPFRILLKAFTA